MTSSSADLPADMDLETFDTLVVDHALRLAARNGWARLSLVEAAREANLPLDTVRERFPFRHTVLLHLGRMADSCALSDDNAGGTVRERLFDMLMRRLDIFQQYRDGVRAALRGLPYEPPLAALLAGATMNTMRWLTDAAGVDITGPGGLIRLNAIVAVWGYAVRAWEKDDSADLATTMSALDSALDRAERFGMLKANPDLPAPEARHDLPDLSESLSQDFPD